MSNPRVILFDLETLPNLKEAMKVFTGLGAYPGLTLKASINSVICVGWKVLGEKETHCFNAWDFPKRWEKSVNDDLEVVKWAREIIAGADVVITHNGKRFDWKFFQTRIAYHGLEPLPKIHHIDTVQESKKHLYLFNNRLNTVAKFLTKTKKKDTGGWELWEKVLERDRKSQKKMTAYCKQDVRVLEKVFKKLLPFIRANQLKKKVKSI